MINWDENISKGGRWFVNFSEVDDSSLSTWDVIVDFSGYAKPDHRVSLPRYLYDNQERLIAIAVSSIDEYEFIRCGLEGLSVSEFLEVDSDYSYWKTSGVTEKCVVRNPELEIYLKLVALDDLLKRYSPSSVGTNGCDPRILNHIKRLVDDFECKIKEDFFWFLKPIVSGIFLRLRALARFSVYTFQVILLKRYRLNRKTDQFRKEEKKMKQILFFSYSSNINSGSNKHYKPVYWKGLPKIIGDNFDSVIWAHLYDSTSGASRKTYCKSFKELEHAIGNPHHFVLLDQFLSFRLVLRAMIIYIKLQGRAYIVENAIKRHHSIDRVDPWSFLKSTWDRSLKGGTSAAQIIQKLLFDDLTSVINQGSACIYVFEGMPWEQMLVHSWNNNVQGKLFGYQHATVKSFDLRPLTYLLRDKNGQCIKPITRILVNGLAAKNSLMKMGFSYNWLVDVEATRFDHLDKKAHNFYYYEASTRSKVLLVLEGLEHVDRFLLGLICDPVFLDNTNNYRFILKLHPNGKISEKHIRAMIGNSINWSISKATIDEAFVDADIVCSSVNSSAAIEARILGLPLVQIWKANELIRSSMDIENWEEIVSTSSDLLEALINTRPLKHNTDHFYFDSSRARWRGVLLGINSD